MDYLTTNGMFSKIKYICIVSNQIGKFARIVKCIWVQSNCLGFGDEGKIESNYYLYLVDLAALHYVFCFVWLTFCFKDKPVVTVTES